MSDLVIKTRRITVLVGVPKMLDVLRGHVLQRVPEASEAIDAAAAHKRGVLETAPIVTLVHPFRRAPGTVGEPIAGVDVKIAADGEILVRGPNVTPG